MYSEEGLRPWEAEKLARFRTQVVAVGWDLDGTLLPSTPEINTAVQNGIYARIDESLGCGPEEAKRIFDETYIREGGHTQTLDVLCGEGAGRQYFNTIWERLKMEDFIKPNPAVVEMVEELHSQGIRQFIISNGNSLSDIVKKLECMGVDPKIFEIIVASNDFGIDKPDSRIFNYALEEMGLQPTQVVFVGDSEGTDIVGANGAGWWSVRVGADSPIAQFSVVGVDEVPQLFGIR